MSGDLGRYRVRTVPVRVALLSPHAVVADALELAVGRGGDLQVVGSAQSVLGLRARLAVWYPDVVLVGSAGVELPAGFDGLRAAIGTAALVVLAEEPAEGRQDRLPSGQWLTPRSSAREIRATLLDAAQARPAVAWAS